MQNAVRAVEALEAFEQQQQSLQMPALELVILAIKWMRNRVSDLLLLDVFRDRVDVVGGGLKLLVIQGRDAPDEHMHLAAIFGDIAGELFTYDHVAALSN